MSKSDPLQSAIAKLTREILASSKARHSETIFPNATRLLIERGIDADEYRISLTSEAWMQRTYGKPQPARKAKR